MLNSLKEVTMLSNDGPRRSVQDRLCVTALLGFLFNRGARGGTRIFLNLAMGLVVLLIIARLMPQRMSQSTFGSISQNLWGAIGGESSQDDGSVPGGLRIVVFGENDIGTPVGPNEEMEGAVPWTQALCTQLGCSGHVSMVPPTDGESWSISSNELYARGVEVVLNGTHDKTTPGWDYSYLSTYYPTQWSAPDLKDQITQFLAMPKPRHPPKETLWVFSFGLWDVWSLSALPIPVGEETVKLMTKDIFKQIERLYAASMDSSSIAWSDINSVVEPKSDSATPNIADEAGNVVVNREEGAEPKATDETFRVLIPRIVDPSLLPGWRDLRPILPAVHSKAEQMRNAAELTAFWNDGIVQGLTTWVRKENPKPEEVAAANKKQEDARGAAVPDENKRTHPRSDDRIKARAAEPEAAADSLAEPAASKALPIPKQEPTYPKRDGFAYNLADWVLDQMVERQLRNTKEKDASGLGTKLEDRTFRIINAACVQPVSTVAVSVSVSSDITLNIPNVYVGKDIQVPTTPAPVNTQQKQKSGKRDDDVVEKRNPEAVAQDGGIEKKDAVRVCHVPSDHLFYTPFTLSQTAIGEIAAQAAEMVRKGQTVKARLDAQALAVGRPKVATPPAHALTGESRI